MKRSAGSGIIAFVLLLGILSPLAHAADALVFSFVPDKTEVKKSEAAIFSLKLENKGTAPVYVNTRFFINDPSAPPRSREVTLSVISPKGDALKFKKVLETGLPKTDYFVKLDPGKSASLEYKRDLKGYFDMADVGEYKIVATYENACGPEIGIDAAKGKVVSSEVKIKVTE